MVIVVGHAFVQNLLEVSTIVAPTYHRALDLPTPSPNWPS
jgi:hypothetical protein